MSEIKFDKQHFDDIYQKYAGIVYRTSYKFLLNKEDAEDVVQEVFIKYFTCNKKFNDDDYEKAWILRVTINLCKNILRSKSRKHLQLDEKIKINDDDFEGSRIQHLDLENTMAELPDNQRMAIYLYYYEQISIKDIAKIMKKNENTVKSYLLRAKSKMKTYLE